MGVCGAENACVYLYAYVSVHGYVNMLYVCIYKFIMDMCVCTYDFACVYSKLTKI